MAEMNEKEKCLLESARAIKRYCKNQFCDGDCVFKLKAGLCAFEFMPPQKRCGSLYWCDGGPAYTGKACRLKAGKDGVPANWKISDADIKRLEEEANLEKGIEAIERLAECPDEKII